MALGDFVDKVKDKLHDVSEDVMVGADKAGDKVREKPPTT